MKYKKDQYYQLVFKNNNQVEHYKTLKSIYAYHSPAKIGCNIDWLWKNKISPENPFENSKVKISLIEIKK